MGDLWAMIDTTAHKPRLRRRDCGGWLAVSEPDDDLRIGVTGPTEVEARKRFGHAVEAWLRLLGAARLPDGVEPRQE